MPVKPSRAKLWFYSDFLPATQNKHLLEDRPEDWKRLQVWNGTTLVPALQEGFKGTPTDDQIEQLYQHMLNGTLFMYVLGDPNPQKFRFQIFRPVSLDPKAPVAPEPPVLEQLEEPNVPDPDHADNQGKVPREYEQEYREQWSSYTKKKSDQRALQRSYDQNMNIYNSRLNHYNDNVDILRRLGSGFVNAVRDFNRGRDLEQEAREDAARTKNEALQLQKRKREHADRVISELMSHKPVAVPEMFYTPNREDVPKRESEISDATFDYKVYDNYIERNGYELPRNLDLDEYDVATINFLMAGAKTHMAEYTLNHMEEGGPITAELRSVQSYNMLITGMFGKTRKSQPVAQYLGEALVIGKEAIERYAQGDAGTLGRHLKDFVENLQISFASYTLTALSNETVAATPMVERLLKLFEKKPDILAAAGLEESQMEFLRGYAQLGRIFDNYVDADMKANHAEAHGIRMSPEERTEILADAVIRRMVEMEFEASNKRIEASEAYQTKLQECVANDAKLRQEYKKWLTEQKVNRKDEKAVKAAKHEYLKHHDLDCSMALVGNLPGDYTLIRMLGKPGLLERLRQHLRKDPDVIAQAQQPGFGLDGNKEKALLKSPRLSALAEQKRPAVEFNLYSEAQKHNWFVSMKAMLARGKVSRGPDSISPWLNPRVDSDRDRLLIVHTDDKGKKSLVNVTDLLKKGLKDLQNPDAKTLELLHKHARAGNLYYYDVGKDMPMRLNADGDKASYEHVNMPQKPTFWKRVVNIFTLGRGYAHDFKKLPRERDPEAQMLFVAARKNRSAIARTEEEARRQAAPRGKQAEERKITRVTDSNIQFSIDNQRSAFNEVADERLNFKRPGLEGDTIIYPEKHLDKLLVLAQGKNGVAKYTVSKDDNPFIAEQVVAASKEAERLFTTIPRPAEDIRRVMAHMVLIEVVRKEQFANQGKEIGPVEQGMRENREKMVDALVNNKVFRSYTRDPSIGMLGQFILTDGAKNMEKDISRALKEMSEKREARVMETTPEHTMEKTTGGRGIGT